MHTRSARVLSLRCYRQVTLRSSSPAIGVSGRWLSDGNITYSGGQATEGQGGYYGSGGARKIDNAGEHTQQMQMLALAADVQKITAVMGEVETLESLLESETKASNGEVTGKSIEIKANIKKLVTSPDFTESLNRLEIQGEPVWGLSSNERELIIDARTKVLES
mmetsp:Transcript_919/g.2090  ORF Transcript_919/g.2090 Transcript_919/m.2090 type:complete len:164 (-) Transcript_919:214-705(-)|eukprot:CAMPEP_0185811530 /NCGR_PEP_ID=MMETSP1322-20130828/8160_1 /TAXON_ID=265543 /ORGANISM="Minutocellus polymorphus, Strain RCC2270" /LENGTH=163 /DNA_ID=CAMNT_0028507987 /DNA_START=124 /DNA_END=615 /DNA_ORIENTATION=+